MIVALGHAAIPDLIEALSRTTVERDQWRILLAMAEIGGQDVVPTMISFLQSRSSAIRALAAQFLGKVGDKRAVEPMINVLGEDDPDYTPAWAIQALGLLGDRRAVDPLIAVLGRTESSTERYMSIEALGLLGDPKAAPSIREHVFDQDHHVRDRAHTALRRLGGESA